MFCIVIIKCLLFTCIVDFWKKNGTFNDPIGIQSLQNDHHHNQLQTSLVHKNHNTKGLTQPLSSSSSSSSLLFESRMSSFSGIKDNNSSPNNETSNNKLKNRYDNVMNSVDDKNDVDGENRFSPSTTTITTTATTNHADVNDNIYNHNDNISINSIFDFDKVIELVNKSVDQSLKQTNDDFSNDVVNESDNYELNHDDTIVSVKDDSLLDESNIVMDDNSVYSGFFDIHNYHNNKNDSSNNDVTNNSSLLLQDGKNDSFQYDVSVDDDFSNIIYDNIDNTNDEDYINDDKSLSDDKYKGSSNDIDLQNNNNDSVVPKSVDYVDTNNDEVDEEEAELSTYLSWLDKQHH